MKLLFCTDDFPEAKGMREAVLESEERLLFHCFFLDALLLEMLQFWLSQHFD
jgi:hypothetical protein